MKQIYGRLLLLGFLIIAGLIVVNAVYFQPSSAPRSRVTQPEQSSSQALEQSALDTPAIVVPNPQGGGGEIRDPIAQSEGKQTPQSGPVLDIQKHLAQKNYYHHPLNGIDSLSLRAAILKYETDRGLSLSGLADGVTLKRLSGGTAGIELMLRDDMAKQSYQTIVRKVQRDLFSAGFDSGRVDGIWDKGTKQAIEAFEYNFQLKVTGQIYPHLLDILARQLKDPNRYLKPFKE